MITESSDVRALASHGVIVAPCLVMCANPAGLTLTKRDHCGDLPVVPSALRQVHLQDETTGPATVIYQATVRRRGAWNGNDALRLVPRFVTFCWNGVSAVVANCHILDTQMREAMVSVSNGEWGNGDQIARIDLDRAAAIRVSLTESQGMPTLSVGQAVVRHCNGMASRRTWGMCGDAKREHLRGKEMGHLGEVPPLDLSGHLRGFGKANSSETPPMPGLTDIKGFVDPHRTDAGAIYPSLPDDFDPTRARAPLIEEAAGAGYQEFCSRQFSDRRALVTLWLES